MAIRAIRKTQAAPPARAAQGGRQRPRPRLSIFRSLHHIYVQVISDQSGTYARRGFDRHRRSVRDGLKSKRNLAAAKAVGKAIAERCLRAGISSVVFDRNGFLYHGRVKALADAAREAGLKF